MPQKLGNLQAITLQPQLDRIISTVSQGSDPRHPPSRTVRPPFRLFDPFSARLDRFQPNDLQDSRSYLRRRRVQFRGVRVYYHKAPLAVYPKITANPQAHFAPYWREARSQTATMPGRIWQGGLPLRRLITAQRIIPQTPRQTSTMIDSSIRSVTWQADHPSLIIDHILTPSL